MKKSEYEAMYLLEDSHFWFRGKRFFIYTYLQKIKAPLKKILDLGSGTGATTKFLENFGIVTGLEKNLYAISLARKRGLKIIQGEAANLPFKKNSFDLVTVFDVLYHKNIKDINVVLKEIYRVLKPGGYLLITDCAFAFLSGKHSQELQESRRFTLKSLDNILNQASFQIVASSYMYTLLLPLIFLKRNFFDRLFTGKTSDVFKLPNLINNLFTIWLKFESHLLKYINLPLGSSLIILAKKET